MTAQVHDHPTHDAEHRPDTRALQEGGLARPARPRWLLPGLAAGLAAAALVVAGVVSPSTVLYAGLFGGMVLMHLGGHGGHGGHGGTTPDAGDLSHRSHRSQLERSGSDQEIEDRASNSPNGSETHDDDQHSSHGCH